MGDNGDSRDRWQTAENAARAAKAAYHVLQGAATGGVEGAAVAAAQEALPFIVKIVAAVLIIVFLIPMLVFTALPNMFFGYDGSGTETVMSMTEQAMAVGGAYMSLEDFENTQVDAFVTSILAEYEERGITVDRVEIRSELDEDDLCWLIAVNSTVHQQDLNTMSAESIWDFCSARLRRGISLLPGGSSNVLVVKVEKIDPETLMNDLGFDEEAKTWAGALFETISESDALETYGNLYEGYRPSYSGDSPGGGGYQHGTDFDNEIDISGFVSPGTKNNLDLAAYALQAWKNNWGYVWGTYGNVLTESLFAYKLEQYPDGVGGYKDFIEENWLGRRTADCIGLIKGYGWLDAETLKIRYGTNGMPDYGADQMFKAAKSAGVEDVDYGAMDTMPEIVGLAVWKSGHIGVYIGGGKVVEAMGTKYGVVMTDVAGRGWSGWCKLPYINYLE